MRQLPSNTFIVFILLSIQLTDAVAVSEPMITGAPVIAARQAGSQFCGYFVDGDARRPIGCTGTSTCVTVGGVVGCADILTTFVPNDCWEYPVTEYCGASVSQLCCTNYEYPKCATIRMYTDSNDAHPLAALGCYTGSVATTVYAQASATTTGHEALSTVPAVGALFANAVSVPGTQGTSQATSQTYLSSASPTSASSQFGYTPAASSDTPTPTSPGSTTGGGSGDGSWWTSGKIAGVSIGAIVTLAIAAFKLIPAILKCLRKRKQDANNSNSQHVHNSPINTQHGGTSAAHTFISQNFYSHGPGRHTPKPDDVEVREEYVGYEMGGLPPHAHAQEPPSYQRHMFGR